eukprot:CAMPEP_0196133346 /NCGR_PEP_ID=MMETSP0910-20130528/2605_1 /TAXON_ID=49265 /ORGANISM="Thalassiosira rotula, Strain GSO102" /LENGTH=106 /DNA_ID=CAMNT_0041393061 /DNA_START=473 /DNA_END=793 /DNA_ORIENTATION=+
MSHTEEAGSGDPQSHWRPQQRHGTIVEEGRVEVGLSRVVENANRQRMMELTIYLPPAAKSNVPANRCRQRSGTLCPQNGTQQQQPEQWEMDGHFQGWGKLTTKGWK